MGCTTSMHRRYNTDGRRRKSKGKIQELAVFVPILWIPLHVDFFEPLRGLVSRELIEKLSSLRSRIVLLAQENVLGVRSGVREIMKAIDEYLPVVLGLTKKGKLNLDGLVEFIWKSFGDDGKEVSMACVWYELLSMIHLMAALSLWEANLLLIPDVSAEHQGEAQVLEDSKKAAIALMLKASGFLDYCSRHVSINVPPRIRKDMPSELQDWVLEAISVQALGQGVEMQLGLAIECEKATLSVKRRMACELVSYYAQAHYCLSSGCENSNGLGKKLLLFLKYKYLEAKAVACYYHGLVLNKRSSPNEQIAAACCHLAADELLMDSKRACWSFCLAAPVTRVPPVWGAMKYLHKKIPDSASKKSQMYADMLNQDKALQSLPDLPEFPLSLRPDEYNLPDIDESWTGDSCQPQVQTLKEHLKDEDE